MFLICFCATTTFWDEIFGNYSNTQNARNPIYRYRKMVEWSWEDKKSFFSEKTPFLQGLKEAIDDANGDCKEAEVHMVPDEDKNEAKSKSLGQNNPTKDSEISANMI